MGMIYGALEIADEMDMTLSAEIIMIQGDTAQLVAGTADAPYQHNFDLILMGNHETEDQPLPDGPNLGLLRQTTTTFGFKGPLNKVAKILKAFEGTMGTASCKGCPPGTLPAKADKSFDDIVQGEWDECWP